MKMQLINNLKNVKPHHKNAVLTIGNFDGVHLGHQHLIHLVTQKAKMLSKPSMVITFEPLPNEYFLENPPARLATLREKLLLFNALNVDYVLCLTFNRYLANLTPEKFVNDILLDALEMNHLIVGEDFYFGKGRAGDAAFLKTMSQQKGFGFEVVQKMVEKKEKISSTRIREALSSSDFNLATQLLGRPYSLQGRILHGQKRGKQLGFPTINIGLQGIKPVLSGVFVVQVFGLTDTPLFGVANIGKRPTFNGSKIQLEVHLLNFNQSVYGRRVTVIPLKKIRDEKKFPDVDSLAAQIENDVQLTKQFLKTI